MPGVSNVQPTGQIQFFWTAGPTPCTNTSPGPDPTHYMQHAGRSWCHAHPAHHRRSVPVTVRSLDSCVARSVADSTYPVLIPGAMCTIIPGVSTCCTWYTGLDQPYVLHMAQGNGKKPEPVHRASLEGWCIDCSTHDW